MVLIDAGAEYELYCADVTRTFPVGRRFDGRQRAVYEVVLGAQLAAIETVRPGVRFEEVHKRAVTVLSDGLVELGLLHGSPTEIVENLRDGIFYVARTVGIFDTQDECSAMMAGKDHIKQGHKGCAEMRSACRGRGDTDADGHGIIPRLDLF